MSQILIDTGRSRRGWSRIEEAFRCDQLWAYGDAPGGLDIVSGFETRDALIMGSLGHTGAAHFYRRMQAVQQGEDPDQWLRPLEAMDAWCDVHPEGEPHLEAMQAVFAAYMREYPEAPGWILEVEREHYVMIGWRWSGAAWDFGLWYLGDEDEVREEEVEGIPREGMYVSRYAGPVCPYRLNVPGHADHGRPLYRTRRLDLMVRATYFTESWDHKFKSFVGKRTFDEYLMDGQFELARQITKQRYAGERTRVRLNAIRRAGTFTVERPEMPSCWADLDFPRDLIETEERVLRKQAEGRDPWHFGRARNCQVCRSPYGTCSALRVCWKGETEVRRGR